MYKVQNRVLTEKTTPNVLLFAESICHTPNNDFLHWIHFVNVISWYP